MAPKKVTQKNGKLKEQTDSVTETNCDAKRSSNGRKGRSQSQPTPVNIIHYKMHNKYV